MAKSRAKQQTPTSHSTPSQLTLYDLLEQETGKPIEWEVLPTDVGGGMLEIISKGLYPDPMDCIREYIQNSVDGLADTVTISITGNSVVIADDGIGMDVEGLEQSRQLGISYKSRTMDVGFRGIGIYSSFDICNRLRIMTKKRGMPKSYILEFDFEGMKAQLRTEEGTRASRTSLTQILTKHSRFRQEPDTSDRHYTIVQLEDLSNVHIGQLSNREQLRKYIEQTVPIDFADNFPYKELINSQLRNYVPGYHAIRVKLTSDTAPPEIIVRPNIPHLSEPMMGPIRNADQRPIAFYWACLHLDGKQIPDIDYRGLAYKVKGFTIGDRLRLRAYFSTAKGSLYYWYTGDVYVIDENVTPNAARNDFEASQEKVQLETAVGDVMRELNKEVTKFQQQRAAEREFWEVASFLDEVEREMSSYPPQKSGQVYRDLERHLEELEKKRKRGMMDQHFAQRTIDKAQTLARIIRRKIDHPEESVEQPSDTTYPPSPNVTPSSGTQRAQTPFQSPPKEKGSDNLATKIVPLPLHEQKVSIPPPAPPQQVAMPSSAPLVSPMVPSQQAAVPPCETISTIVPASESASIIETFPQAQSARTLVQIVTESGIEIGEPCSHLIRLIDTSLVSILTRESSLYREVLDDLQARIALDISGDLETEEE